MDVVSTDIGLAGVDGTRRRSQPGQERSVPLDTEIALPFRSADGTVAIMEVPFSLCQPRVEVSHPSQDADPGPDFTERIELDAPVPLLTIETEDPGNRIGRAARQADLECREARAEASGDQAWFRLHTALS